MEGEFGYTTSGTDDGWASSDGGSGDDLGDYEVMFEHPGDGDADNLMLI